MGMLSVLFLLGIVPRGAVRESGTPGEGDLLVVSLKVRHPEAGKPPGSKHVMGFCTRCVRLYKKTDNLHPIIGSYSTHSLTASLWCLFI